MKKQKCGCWDKRMVIVPGTYPDIPEGFEMKLGHHPLCDKRPAERKYVKVSYDGSSYIDAPENLPDSLFYDAEPGEVYIMEIVMMRPDVLAAMPEFEGF